MRWAARERDPIRPWYEAIEAEGDYHTFRFCRVTPDDRVEWHRVSHKRHDGIGGFVHLLRAKGIDPVLPRGLSRGPRPSWWPFLRGLPAFLAPRRGLAWRAGLRVGAAPEAGALPDPAAAWHVCSQAETDALRAASRSAGVTLNTFLLKHLDVAVRGDLADSAATIPWMVPVNLRGRIHRADDTSNHSSFLSVRVSPQSSLREVHADVQQGLAGGAHWGPWKTYAATQWLPQWLKRRIVRADRVITPWHFGLFSNLGEWDAAHAIRHAEVGGAWVLMATVLRCQPVGAAAMTFQGRLGLSIQVHPTLTRLAAVPRGWMAKWLAGAHAAIDAPVAV
ncbi:MAG: hypothetical protein AAF628_25630 [Planctomycetota bacterium]